MRSAFGQLPLGDSLCLLGHLHGPCHPPLHLHYPLPHHRRPNLLRQPPLLVTLTLSIIHLDLPRWLFLSHLAIAILIAHEKRFRTTTHLATLHIFWVTFVLLVTLYSLFVILNFDTTTLIFPDDPLSLITLALSILYPDLPRWQSFPHLDHYSPIRRIEDQNPKSSPFPIVMWWELTKSKFRMVLSHPAFDHTWGPSLVQNNIMIYV